MKNHELTIIPAHIQVKLYKARVALGARKPRWSGAGSAQSTSTIAGKGYNQALRNYAAKGFR
jgi:hypothetical protein